MHQNFRINFTCQCVMFTVEKVTTFIELNFKTYLSLSFKSTNCLFYQFGDGKARLRCAVLPKSWSDHLWLGMLLMETSPLSEKYNIRFRNYILFELCSWDEFQQLPDSLGVCSLAPGQIHTLLVSWLASWPELVQSFGILQVGENKEH